MENGNPFPLKRSLFDYLVLSLKGFLMGAADVVPGVSGGTIAFILGIYQELLAAIKSLDFQTLRLLFQLQLSAALERFYWRFLCTLGLGILAAIFSLARVLSWLLHNRPILVWSFFFGLVLASSRTVATRLTGWRPSTWAWITAGTIGSYWIVGLVPVATPTDRWFIFLSGAVAICAMILPGISGSFILVLLGKYQYILDAVNQRDLLVLAVFAAGACAGIAAFSRFLSWLFKRYHDVTVSLLTGFMLGSLRKVWPWKGGEGVLANALPREWNMETQAALCLMAAGVFLVLLIDRMAGRRASAPRGP